MPHVIEALLNMEDFKSIKQIAKNLFISYCDYKYFSSSNGDILKAAFLDQNQNLFSRIRYYLYFFTIVELYKLFYYKEFYSISKFLNREIKDNDNSPKVHELKKLLQRVKAQSTQSTLSKVCNIRKKYLAHLDANRLDYTDIKINVQEIDNILEIVKDFLIILNPVYEGSEYTYPYSETDLGYKLHEPYFKLKNMGH